MDTFECYCRNKSAMTTINKAAATVFRQAQQPCDNTTPSRLRYRAIVPRRPIIHSRIVNAGIQDF